MNDMTADLMNPNMMAQQMTSSGPSFSHSQVSYMTMTSDGTGTPQVYQVFKLCRESLLLKTPARFGFHFFVQHDY